MYPNGYSFRRLITIDNTKVAGGSDLTDFPALFSGVYTYLKTVGNGGEVESASGHDIRFETTAGVKLDHEIEYWDGATGTVVFWIRIPTLLTATDTEIYIYYGNSSVVSTEANSTGVWGSNYVAVYHMSTGTGNEEDSTSNNYDLTETGTVTQNASGKLASARERTSVDSANFLSKADATDLDGMAALTFQAWIYPTSGPNSNVRAIVSKRAGSASQYSYGAFMFTSDLLNFDTGNSAGNNFERLASATAPAIDDWTLFHCTFDGSLAQATRKNIYINGGLDQTGTAAVTTIYNSTAALEVFKMGGSTGAFQGMIDELRILKTALSADWITTEYNNHDDPATFYTIGSEETNAPTESTITGISSIQGIISITF